jgi:NADH:ubiquinone oxidoreductase subunit C
MDAETILHLLDGEAGSKRRSDGWWTTMPDLDVRAMADLMRTHEIRFITLTAIPDVAGGYRMIYHWDADGTLVNVATTVTTGSIPTISDILPAADWVEREIRDYYALEFDGRAETPTLMLRDGDEPGLFSRTCTVGKDVDPAETAREAAAPDPEGV